jgi:D-alanyl-D-alanine carboxypeptidase
VRKFFCIFLLLLILLQADDAFAGRRKRYRNNVDFTKSQKYASLIVNASTGDVIHQINANKQLHPASLTKMMTLYLTFEAIDNGQLSLNQQLPVSIKAASMPRTNLSLRRGQTITVRDAILGLIIRSANDAAVVLAEAIAGSEAKFAKQMTDTARDLGMSKTVFKNASGLPNKEQVTSAYDMARLGIALRRDYPQFYPLFSKKSFQFRGTIVSSHNKVLDRYPWADGLKTGFTLDSGYNLVTSTVHKRGKLVGVVLGGSSAGARDSHMIKLLDRSYAMLGNVQVAQKTRSPFSYLFNKSSTTQTSGSQVAIKTEQNSASVFDAVEKLDSKVATISTDMITVDPFQLIDNPPPQGDAEVTNSTTMETKPTKPRKKAKIKKMNNKAKKTFRKRSSKTKKQMIAAQKKKINKQV